MDFKNDGVDSTNFMNKVKKQAKKILKLSKENPNNLKVTNLAQAQELIARVNGYPDWHALENKINGSKNVAQLDIKKLLQSNNPQNGKNIDMVNLTRYENSNIYYLEDENSITTFLRFKYMHSGLNNLISLFKIFEEKFSFLMNMLTHDFSMFIHQQNRNHINALNKAVENNYNLTEVSKSFNLTEEEIKDLFFIKSDFSSVIETNDLTIYLVIKTAKKNSLSHIDLIDSILKSGNIMDVVPFFNKNILEQFVSKDSFDTNDSLNLNLMCYHTTVSDRIKGWIYLLNYLGDKKISFFCYIPFKSDVKRNHALLKYKFLDYENRKETIDGFINAAKYTNIFEDQDFNYPSKLEFVFDQKNSSNTNGKGVNFKSKINNTIFNYNHGSDKQLTNINLIHAKPGLGKTELSKTMILSSILNESIENFPTLAIVDVGTSYEGMIEFIKNIVPETMRSKIQQFDIKNTNEYAMNLFDLPLGRKMYTDDDSSRIANILKVFFDSSVSDSLDSALVHICNLLNIISEKIYEAGKNIEIDTVLKKINFKIAKDTTWFNIVDILFINEFDVLATKAQKFATPIIEDILPILRSDNFNHIYGKVIVKTRETLTDHISRILMNAIKTYPFINSPTRLNIDSCKIAYFNLDSVCSFMDKEIKNYWFSNILHAIKYKLIGLDSFEKDTITRDWTNDWKFYLANNALSSVYKYYNRIKITSNTVKKVILDEYHRFSYTNDSGSVISLVREARKFGVHVSILTQSIDDMKSLQNFASAMFVSYSSLNERDISSLNFSENEIKLMKKSELFDWSLKLMTYQGPIFDILKLETTDLFKFALSTTKEDMIVKNCLTEKIGYMSALKKSVDYLKRLEVKSFKTVVEAIKNESENRDVKEDYIQKIVDDVIKKY